MPEFEFPEFPVPEKSVFDEENETVTVSLDWYCAVAAYKADIDAIKVQLEQMKDYKRMVKK